MATGFQENSGIEQIDALLSRGGMDSMLLTIWPIIGAVTFGIMVDDFGLRNKLVTLLLLRARTVGRLIASVVATAIGLNIAAGDQYIALLLPTRLFKSEFARRGLAPENLSRAVCGYCYFAVDSLELLCCLYGGCARCLYHGLHAFCHL
ncbi:Na+/H+ antiporter NhaC family protein [Candidatus Symbiopectobacterium sp. 'North America']|uniref:Na+/H+ antiporter NhaC family protein n=1 Tax=Candidatus Symbiopectobacterium sp. 'North America' TaxID=2794574 RepID=UPI0024556A10|nr:Na+/H+ antiporter NhaC family protein [Candidatus Symbiopectobacterium sp. 'North America']